MAGLSFTSPRPLLLLPLHLLLLLLVTVLVISPSHGTLVRKEIAYVRNGRSDYTHFLSHFGVEKGHTVYVFGTSSRIGNSLIGFHSQITLAFLPEDAWQAFSDENRKIPQTPSWCKNIMHAALNNSLSTGDCDGGTQDYLRIFPCNEGRCGNQPPDEPLMTGTEFTYRINSPKTQFYYLFLIGCTRHVNASVDDPLCDWSYTDKIDLNFSIHLTNSDPTLITPDPFIYEFPYQNVGALIIMIVFLSIYIGLAGFHFMMHSAPCNPRGCKMHRLVAVFSLSITLELFHIVFNMIHFAVYASDGMGVMALRYLGEVCNLFSDWFLILVLLLIGKGWQLTTCSLRWKKVTFTVWAVYIFFSFIYFIWVVIQSEVFPYNTWSTHPFQSWAGGVYLAYRVLLLAYLLFELRQVYLIENSKLKLYLYRMLIVFFIVWFCYLPVIIVIAIAVNPVLRGTTISTVRICVDLLANVTMVLLFFPKWAGIYFQFDRQLYNEIYVPLRYTPGDKSLKSYGSYSDSLTSADVPPEPSDGVESNGLALPAEHEPLDSCDTESKETREEEKSLPLNL